MMISDKALIFKEEKKPKYSWVSLILHSMVVMFLLSLLCLCIYTQFIANYKVNDVSAEFDILDRHWDVFRMKYKKKYSSENEEQTAKMLFLRSLKYVLDHNLKFYLNETTFEVEINEFSDMETREIANIRNGYRQTSFRSSNLPKELFVKQKKSHELPDHIDWRQKGAVTNVKNQGMCGSCWAFSATGALEGQLFVNNSILTSLSEQNLIDCSRDEGNNGCDGGLMDYAFEYIYINHGIDTEAEYPYLGRDGRSCRYKKDGKNLYDTGAVDIPSGDEDALKEAVATKGPISVAIDASLESFQRYRRGVYMDRRCSSKNLDHGVLLVGYGTDSKYGPYWIVKNSWGIKWGDSGYILIARNHNMCGIATQASYPKVV
uniref:Cathepsin L n=1 Tax=Cuerna arida TaxID=1464854 RepID=A0A1B6FNV8_9HEMI